MRTLIAVAAAALMAMGVWSNAASQSSTERSVSKAAVGPSKSLAGATTKPPAISVREIHNQARMEKLPVTDFEDQSLVFTHGSVQPVW